MLGILQTHRSTIMTHDSTRAEPARLVWVKTQISETDHARLKEIADRDERSIAWVARKAILAYLNAHPQV